MYPEAPPTIVLREEWTEEHAWVWRVASRSGRSRMESGPDEQAAPDAERRAERGESVRALIEGAPLPAGLLDPGHARPELLDALRAHLLTACTLRELQPERGILEQ